MLNHAAQKDARLALHSLTHRAVARLLRASHERLVRSLAYSNLDLRFLNGERDYSRGASLVLIADQITRNHVPGRIAEVGAYRGHFTRLINLAFPDREFLIFDTFSGFVDSERRRDIAEGFSLARHDFSHTSPELVLRRLHYVDSVIVIPGSFPDSAQRLPDSQYAFVSIDVDLHEPTAAALNYFWTRLAPGGYIFVHDYNNDEYLGVKRAVDQFISNSTATIVPIPDTGGTAILARPLQRTQNTNDEVVAL